MTDFIFLDNQLVPPAQAKVSALNTAFLFGESLLEAVPVYHGKPLFWGEHMDRLEKGARFLGWPLPPRKSFERAVRLFADKTPGHFILRFGLVQEVDPPAAPRAFSKKAPRLVAMIRPLRHNPEAFQPPMGRAGVSTWAVPPSTAVPGQFKWIFYMMIRQDFRRHPEWDEMLRLNDKGQVVDGGSASPLWFARGAVHASPLGQGGLESVTRAKILELCRSLGIPILEKSWKPAEAIRQGELFFVGSGLGILGINYLSGKALSRPMPFTLRLWQHYRNWALRNRSY